jgi:hypothetical protein
LLMWWLSCLAAVSVTMTGFLSVIVFGTQLSVMYAIGIINVIVALLLYNG